MWLLYLLCHIWLSGSLWLPFMLVLLWIGTKWTRLYRLTGNRRRWLFIWGCFALVKTTAMAGLSLARFSPDIQPAYFTHWAAVAVWSVLYRLHIFNTSIGFLLTFSLDAATEIFIACGLAALALWINGQLTHAAVARQRYEIALLFSACVLGIANHIYAMRTTTCFDCFWPHGFPFTYFHEGGFAGGEGIVWSGVVGNAFVIILVGAILGWMWNRLPRKHPA
jgi:hypothetical protein